MEVTLADGTKIPARLKGSDPWTDLAVLEVDGSQFKQLLNLAIQTGLKSGEPVIAIGNPLGLGFSGSVTRELFPG